MHTRRKKRRRKEKLTWKDVILIVLVIILALLLIFSRGFRAARRVSLDHAPAAQASEPSSGQTAIQAKAVQPYTEPDEVAQIDLQANRFESPSGVAEVPPDDRNGKHTPRSDPGPNGNPEMESNDTDKIKITRDMLLGMIDPTLDEDFVPVSLKYARREGMYLRRAAMDAFLEMHAAAEKDGVQLTILSATRPFQHQKRIWENKWNGVSLLQGDIIATDIEDPVERSREILRFSAMPGTSRHHWGTDIDLNSLQNSYFEHGQGKKVYQWLVENAAGFGFCQPYTKHGNRRSGGYEEEKWHWSYLPLAELFYHAFAETITYDDIRGFDGYETAREMQVIENYVLDINTDCF